MEIKDVFEVLSKGIIVSSNSSKFSEVAYFLSDEDNFNELNYLVNKLGFYLVGENGYFYLSKELDSSEEEKFINNHKDIILAIAQLKKVFVHLDSGSEIKITEFIKRFDSKKDEKIIKHLFGNDDLKTIAEKLFNMLTRAFVLEQINNDEYKVLNSIYYYLDIVEMIGEEDE